MEARIQTFCLMVLALVTGGAALNWLEPALVPLVLAMFFSLGLSALIDLQTEYLRIPRPLAVLSTIIMAVLGFTLVAVLVSASVRQITANGTVYEAQFAKLMAQMTTLIPGELGVIDRKTLLEPLSEIPMATVGAALAQTANAVLGILSRSVLVLVFVLYLMIGGGPTTPSTGLWREVEIRIQRYIGTKAVTSAATGGCVGLILWLLDVDLALAFGLFAFLLNFIPTLGSVVATLLPLPVVLFSPQLTPTAAVLAIVLPGGVQLVVGNFIEPRIMGQSLDLHPITVLITLVFWGMLWGIVGMLLATPITAVMKILFERLEHTKPLAELLAGRIGGATTPLDRTS
ncbi:MAG: AI-2 transport protein TqsA [Hyphomicrobiaceae bacterium]|jgi:AI-2 transport protein TqsA